MRAVAVLLLAPALLLTACGGDADAPSDQVAAESANAALPTVSGEFGERPEIDAPDTDPAAKLVAKTLSEGSGAEVQKGDLLVANYTGQTWREDKVFDSSFERGQPVAFPIGVGSVIPGWDETLVGVPAGSRLLLVIPPDKGYGQAGQPDAGIEGDDTLVFVVDVLDSYAGSAAAQGEQVGYDPGGRLPAVAGGAGEQPMLAIPDREPPSELVAKTLVQGTGPEVGAGQLLVAQYVGVTWRDGKQFDSSWDRGQPAAFPIGAGQVIPGWDQTLVGVKAGSRVLLVIPPDKGYGEQGQPDAGIKGTDTLVFVVDVLGAYGAGV